MSLSKSIVKLKFAYLILIGNFAIGTNDVRESVVRPKLLICCPIKTYFDDKNQMCYPSTFEIEYLVNITINDGKREHNISDVFEVQAVTNDRGKYFYNETEEFRLYQNGSIWRISDGKTLTSDEFCLSLDIKSKQRRLMPAYYYEEKYTLMWYIDNFFIYLLMSSIPFMVLSMCLVILIREMHTVYDKSLCSYLLALSLAYGSHLYKMIHKVDQVAKICKLFAYFQYFLYMASFFWLYVIGFHFYMNFIRKFSFRGREKTFLLYSTYAWGTALIFLAVALAAQDVSWVPYEFKPDIDNIHTNCWFPNDRKWQKFIYFFLPLVCILSFNIVLFIRICWRTRNSPGFSNHLVIQMFGVLGVPWIFDVLSFIFHDKSEVSWFFFRGTDLGAALQGYIIFLYTIRRKPVKLRIKKWFSKSTNETNVCEFMTNGELEMSIGNT